VQAGEATHDHDLNRVPGNAWRILSHGAEHWG
jgi:hypothetical protein